MPAPWRIGPCGHVVAPSSGCRRWGVGLSSLRASGGIVGDYGAFYRRNIRHVIPQSACSLSDSKPPVAIWTCDGSVHHCLRHRRNRIVSGSICQRRSTSI